MGANINVAPQAGVIPGLFSWYELAAGPAPIDFTAVADYLFTVPPGFYFTATHVRTIVTQCDGSLTSAPTAQIGNNAGKTNVVASANTAITTLATINASTTPSLHSPGGGLTNLSSTSSNNTLVSTNTQFTLSVTVGAVLNTATVFKGRVFLGGYLASI